MIPPTETRMVAAFEPHLIRQYPLELLQFAHDEAERDAGDVAVFLTAAGLAPKPGQTRGIPAGILLDLGAFVRLRRWELAGLFAHRDAGIPTARAALARVIDILVAAAKNRSALGDAGTLARAVFDLMVTRFAWHAGRDIGADILLDFPDEDAFVEAMAQFLWDHRRGTPPAHRGPTP